MRQQLVAGLATEGLEVLHRARVGGHHLQHLARREVAQDLLGAKDGERAIEAAHVEFAIGLHNQEHLQDNMNFNMGASRIAASGAGGGMSLGTALRFWTWLG